MITAAPSASFEATAQGYATGLVGTIAVRVVDGQGSTVVARRTTGIVEHPAGSGIYTATLTAPSVAGQYVVAFDNGGASTSSWATEDLVVAAVVTPTAPIVDGTARATMAAIISRVRIMLDDTNTDAPVFSDFQIQEALDARREEARYWRPEMRMVIEPGGTATRWLIFEAGVGPWEDDVVLVNSRFTPISPATTDNWTGRWTFTEQPNIPVMVNGWLYDVNGAAGDLMTMRATMESAAFDVSADGVSLNRSQKAKAYQERAWAYYAKARPRTSDLVRTDERQVRP